MKTKRFMRILSLLTCLCLIFLLASCGEKPPTEFAQFKTEDGFYQYPGVPWGSTVEEVEAVTGWNVKNSFVCNLVYHNTDGTDGVQSLYTVQDASLDGEQCIVELQFDPDGGLWCISIYIPTKTRDLPKRFKAFEKELTKVFGEPDKAVYDTIPERPSNIPSYIPPSEIPWSTVTWRAWDEEGKLVNVCSLGFDDISSTGREEGYLLFGASWKDAGFRVIE